LNDHPDEQRLQKYLTDSLSAADEESVGSHLSNCAVCQSKVEQIIGATFSLQYDEDTKSPVAGTSGENPNLGTRFMVLNELARGGMGVVRC